MAELLHTFRIAGTENDVEDILHIAILAEGYQQNEASSFLQDVRRLVHECIFDDGAAFSSLAAFFAVHAIMVPSKDSGVFQQIENTDDSPQLRGAKATRRRHSTAFSLRREDGPLRTVAPPGSGLKAYGKAKRICSELAPKCDHILLMAQDEWWVLKMFYVLPHGIH